MKAKIFTLNELYKGQVPWYKIPEDIEGQGIKARRAYEAKEMARVRPFSRVRRGKMEYVPGFERKSGHRATVSTIAAGFPQGFMKDKISNPEKLHPFVGQEKPSEALARRGYPDEASRKTTERAIKEVTVGKPALAARPNKVVEPLDINSKQWNDIKEQVESAKEKYGINVENKLRLQIKKISQDAKNPDPNELNILMRVLKDQGLMSWLQRPTNKAWIYLAHSGPKCLTLI